jgi:subtilisin family serine protease
VRLSSEPLSTSRPITSWWSAQRRTVLPALSLLLALIGGGCDDSQEPPAEPSDDAPPYGDAAPHGKPPPERSRSLRLTRDRVALVLDEGSRFEQLEKLLPYGLELSEQSFRELIVLDPTRDTDRDALVDLARELLLLAPDLLDHAGVLVTPAGATEPLLMTHEFLVRFEDDASREQIDALIDRHGFELLRPSEFQPRLLLLATRAGSGVDAQEAAQLIQSHPIVRYAEPNLVHDTELLSTPPNDPLYPQQWHHDNTGQGGGTPDADIDTPLAWEITMGSEDVVIAVLETGFDEGHPDLVENLWSHPELPGAHGWDFEDDDGTVAGDPSDPASSAHGTSVAGCVGARGDNQLGVVGSCPRCSLMLIKLSDPTSYFHDAEAIRFAWNHGADIISNSWTYLDNHPVPEVVREAIEEATTLGRDGKGCLVLFAVRNEELNVGDMQDLAALEGVFAVSAVTNWDERTLASGFGECLAVLGPTRLSKAPGYTQGSLNITTTDWRGHPGYNDDPDLAVVPSEGFPVCADFVGDHDYTACFGGTSAATPIVAGVAGLVLSVAPDLSRLQLQHLLQDTTDRVQPSAGAYSVANGYSAALTHGHGRVNAFEAVRVAAPLSLQGHGGVDVFLRDNALDWGNTEQPSHVRFEKLRGTIGHWRCVDIKVDAPPFAAAPLDLAAYQDFAHEDPIAGTLNKVYVRLRNRGPQLADPVGLSLHWAWGGTSQPALPDGFWKSSPSAPFSDEDLSDADPSAPDPSDLSLWRPLGQQAAGPLPYSGASVAGTEDDGARVLSYDLWAPGVCSDVPGPRHLSLLAVIRSPVDPPAASSLSSKVTDLIVPRDNNVAYRNVALTHPTLGPTSSSWVLVRNPTAASFQTRLQLAGPDGARLRLDATGPDVPAPLVGSTELKAGSEDTQASPWFALEAGQHLLLRVLRLEGGDPGALELSQWELLPDGPRLLSGLDLVLEAFDG